LNTELSILSLFLDATLLVKLIMIGLLCLSVLSWTLILERRKYYRQMWHLLNEFEGVFWGQGDLGKLYQEIQRQKIEEGLPQIFSEGFKEYAHIKNRTSNMSCNQMIRVTQRAMEVAIRREMDALEQHLPFLASVASVTPYIGLFGTVWGIMHAFIALGSVQQATLSMVAPGIAEALIATAMGLFAAIPALLAYNRYATQSNALLMRYENFQEEFVNILFRKMYRTLDKNKPEPLKSEFIQMDVL
jgi:biopolymer transport protein TolQ